MASLLGGLISSTAVTLGFARESREHAQPGRALALGVIAACTVLYVRVGILSSVLNPAMSLEVLPYIAGPLAAGVLASALVTRGMAPGRIRAPLHKPVAARGRHPNGPNSAADPRGR